MALVEWRRKIAPIRRVWCSLMYPRFLIQQPWFKSDVENFHYASQGPALDCYSSDVYQPLKKGVPLRLFGI